MQHIITRARLREFWDVHPESENLLKAWEQAVLKANWTCSADIKRTFRTANLVAPKWVFDVGRNRIIARVRFAFKKANGVGVPTTVFIEKVLTHPEYDKWKAC